MNLVLWRHAEAEDLPAHLSIQRTADLKRPLTERGQKQAERVAHWLRQRLPASARILTSPALRTIQTAQALTPQPEIAQELEPGADVSQVLACVGWPQGPDTVVVGHQPWIGNTASLLLAGSELPWSVRKGGVWWLTSRTREGEAQVVLRAVINPDLL
ncbi:MAG TPA: histidine phosphatase family protein [Burkholderiaceae bacterium]|jgi:phosphohistidine phosphatase|nr:histidine phosphatase family protein [Burkholderiaceae bacterium]